MTPPRGPSPLGRVTLPSPGSGPQRLPASEPRWDKTGAADLGRHQPRSPWSCGSPTPTAAARTVRATVRGPGWVLRFSPCFHQARQLLVTCWGRKLGVVVVSVRFSLGSQTVPKIWSDGDVASPVTAAGMLRPTERSKTECMGQVACESAE